MNLNCPECQREIYGEPTMGPWIRYYCDTCLVNYYYSEDKELIGMNWYVYYKTKFHLSMDYKANKFVVTHEKADGTKEVIINTTSAANWTPKNSIRKLKTHLPFL